jgi:hypothetical protein
MSKYYGCDDLREWLIEQGFKIGADSMARDSGCNWHAWRQSELSAIRCECNDDKEGMQLAVYPWSFRDPSHAQAWESAEIEIRGKAGGLWYMLKAYSLQHSELRQRLPDIEAALVRAWNALV